MRTQSPMQACTECTSNDHPEADTSALLLFLAYREKAPTHQCAAGLLFLERHDARTAHRPFPSRRLTSMSSRGRDKAAGRIRVSHRLLCRRSWSKIILLLELSTKYFGSSKVRYRKGVTIDTVSKERRPHLCTEWYSG